MKICLKLSKNTQIHCRTVFRFSKKNRKLRLCCVNCSTLGDGKKAICLFKNHHIWRYHFDFQSKDVMPPFLSRLEIIMLYDGEETVESDLQLYCSE